MPTKGQKLEGHVFAASAYLAQAQVLADDLEVDAIDDEVICDQLEAAAAHLMNVLWLLHPEWRRMTDEVREARVLPLFRRYRPKIDETLTGRDGVVAQVKEALPRINDGALAARWHGPHRKYRTMGYELYCALDHLDVVLYLLDPDFPADVVADTPEAKVRLASRLETVELALEENRDLVRERLQLEV